MAGPLFADRGAPADPPNPNLRPATATAPDVSGLPLFADRGRPAPALTGTPLFGDRGAPMPEGEGLLGDFGELTPAESQARVKANLAAAEEELRLAEEEAAAVPGGIPMGMQEDIEAQGDDAWRISREDLPARKAQERLRSATIAVAHARNQLLGIEKPPTKDELRNAIDSAATGLLTTGTDFAKAVGITAGALPGAVENNVIVAAADEADEWIRRQFTPDEAQLQEFSSQLWTGSGSMLGFLWGGVLGKAAGKAMGMSPRIAAGTSVGGLGAGVQGTQGYEEAQALGASAGKRYAAFFLNAGIGLSEAGPIDRFFFNVNKASGGKLVNVLANTQAQSIEEFLQEAGTAIGSDAVSVAVLETEKEIGAGALEQGAVGAVLGGIMGAARGGRVAPGSVRGSEEQLLGNPMGRPADIPEGATSADVLYPEPEDAADTAEGGAEAELPDAPGEAGVLDLGEITDRGVPAERIAVPSEVPGEEGGTAVSVAPVAAPPAAETPAPVLPTVEPEIAQPAPAPAAAAPEETAPVEGMPPALEEIYAPPEAAAPPVANKATDLAEGLRDFGKGVTAGMYDVLWSKVQAGDTKENGQESTILQIAKRARDAGGIKTRAAFEALANDYAAIPDDAPDRQAQFKALVTKYSPAAPTPEQTRAELEAAGVTGPALEKLTPKAAEPTENAPLDVASENEAGTETGTTPDLGDKAGHRTAPVEIKTAEDLAAATARPKQEATGPRVEAGNAEKDHIVYDGHPIKIETRKGETRRSKPSDPVAWEVTMPIDYGHYADWKGADGEGLDVSIGVNPQITKAFVIDQVDPDTGEFDEHKVFRGLPTANAAKSIYSRSFSDGRGKDRIGAVTEMSREEFEAWAPTAAEGKPAGQITPRQAAPVKIAAEPGPKAKKPKGLSEIIDAMIRDDDESDDGRGSNTLHELAGVDPVKGKFPLSMADEIAAAYSTSRDYRRLSAMRTLLRRIEADQYPTLYRQGRGKGKKADEQFQAEVEAQKAGRAKLDAIQKKIDAIIGELYAEAMAKAGLKNGDYVRHPEPAIDSRDGETRVEVVGPIQTSGGSAHIASGGGMMFVDPEEIATLEKVPPGTRPRVLEQIDPEDSQYYEPGEGERDETATGVAAELAENDGEFSDGRARGQSLPAPEGVGPVEHNKRVNAEADRRWPPRVETVGKGKKQRTERYAQLENMAFQRGADGIDPLFAMPINVTVDQIADAYNAGVEWRKAGFPETPAPTPAPEKPKAAKPEKPAPAEKWKEIGKNTSGETIYEDERGVRSRLDGSVRITEPVEMVPTKEGGMRVRPRADRGSYQLEGEAPRGEPPAEPPAAGDPNPNITMARNAAMRSESAWQVELQRLFGKRAGDVRYVPEGQGQPGTLLNNLYLDYVEKRDTWQALIKSGGVAPKPQTPAPPPAYVPAGKVPEGRPPNAMGIFNSMEDLAQYIELNLPAGYLLSRMGSAIGIVEAKPDGKVVAEWTARPEVKEVDKRLAKLAKEKPARPAGFGAKNKLVTNEEMDELRAKLRAKMKNQLSAGVDPEFLTIGMRMTAYYIEAGVRKLADIIKMLAEDADVEVDKLRPHIRAWYEAARAMMEDAGEDTAGMDSPDEARAAIRALAGNTNAERTDVQQTPPEVPAGEPAGDVQGAQGEGDAGRPRSERGPVGDGDVRVDLGADGDQQGSAKGLPGKGGSARVNPARRGGNRSGRGRVPAAPGPVEQAAEEAEESREQRTERNYIIKPDEAIGEGGPKFKVRANIEAIRLLKEIEAEKREATEDEKAALVRYVGWGAFAQDVFADAKPEWKVERQQLRDLLTAEELRAARASTLNAHYTSRDVIAGMWQAVRHLGFTKGRALEPSAGIGHFIGLQPRALATRTDWSAVELDSITGRIAKLLYAGADVNVMGFEEFQRPDNFYDLAISNVPFGDFKIRDPKYPQGFSIHDYFFVKALDKVRPGGIVAFITSRYTLDKVADKARREVAKRAEFLGAIRLPGGKKGAFAGNAGTEVTTDIIFLRKKIPGAPSVDAAWMNVHNILAGDGQYITINEYFVANPGAMLGKMELSGSMYGSKEPVLIGSTENIDKQIAEAAKKFLPAGALIDLNARPVEKPVEITVDEKIKPGAFFEQDGKLLRRIEGVGQAAGLSKVEESKVRALMRMRDLVNKILARDPKSDTWRKRLGEAYDAFVKKHGPIGLVNTTVTSRMNKEGEPVIIRRLPNFKSFSVDPDAYKVLAIENYDEETGSSSKAAIFTEDMVGGPINPTIATPADAAAVSLDRYGRLIPEEIGKLLNMAPQAAMQELGDLVYRNPDGGAWQTAAEYLSGDVLTKLEDARTAARTSDQYERNVKALEAVQPAPLTAVDIRAQMGAPWVPVDVYEQFLNEEVGGTDIKLSRDATRHAWTIRSGRFNRAAAARFATSRIGIEEVAKAAMNNEQVRIVDSIGDGKTAFNADATLEANLKITEMRVAFTGDPELGIDPWWSRDPERTARMEVLYNRTFNRYVKRDVSGAHLSMPGLATKIAKSDGTVVPFALRPHQKDAIWRVVQDGNTLLDHVVGAGKTFTMIGAGMEQKRLGLIRRPMYVVPNHMLEQFSREFLQAYPNASILVADKDSMSLARRKEFAGRVAAEPWDGIIITHDAFGRIGMSKSFNRDFLNEQLDEYREILEDAREAEGKGSQTVKNIERDIKAMEARLAELMKEEGKDEGATFEELGVDFLFVDEAHLFKNLAFATKMKRVKGLGGTASQRATGLFMKIRYLEGMRPGRAAVFATGTPISNTIAEMFTMQRYLQLARMKELGIDKFDAWANTFGEVVTKPELSADGRSFRDSTSFSRFVNIPELISIYSQVADTRTAEMLNLPRPEMSKRADGSRGIIIVEAEPTPSEEAYIVSLVQRAEAARGKKAEKGGDNMLKIVTEGRKVATDFRLLFPDAPMNPAGKAALLMENVLRIWERTKPQRSAQMIFLDMGTPKGKGAASDGIIAAQWDRSNTHEREAWARRAGSQKEAFTYADLDREWSALGTPEKAKLRKAKPEPAEDAPSPGVTFIDEEGNVHGDIEDAEAFASQFDLYTAVRDSLVARGIPRSEIAFIHEASDDTKKALLFEKVRRGQVRVLIGSTGKMGMGTNVQKKLYAMHHWDAPWKPAEVEQRDGRILRQGNENEEVEIYRYVLRRSFDAFMWQTLERKAGFISQLKAGARGVRVAEDIDDPLPDAAELKAAASGDPRIQEHAELRKKVQVLEAQSRGHERTIREAKWKLESDEKSLALTNDSIVRRTADAALVQDVTGKNFAMDLTPIGAGVVTKWTDAGKAIIDWFAPQADRIYEERDRPRELKIGTLSGLGMRLMAYRQTAQVNGQHIQYVVIKPELQGEDRYYTSGSSAEFAPDMDSGGMVSRFTTILPVVKESLAYSIGRKAEIEAGLPALRDLTKERPFPRKDELAAAIARLKELTKELSDAGKPKPAAPPAGPSATMGSTAARAPARIRISVKEQAELTTALRAEIKRIAGGDVQVWGFDKLSLDTLPGESRAALSAFEAAGGLKPTMGGTASVFSTGEAMVRIALQDPSFPDHWKTAWHEAYHVVEMRSMTDEQIAELQSPENMAIAVAMAAKSQGIHPDYVRMQPGYEIRAIAFEQYVATREAGLDPSPAGSALLQWFKKLLDIIEAVRGALARRGYRTIDQIFEDVYQGRYKDQPFVFREPATLAQTAPRDENLDPFARGGAVARQREVGRRLDLGQPIDRVIRIPFQIFGGVNEYGQWRFGLRLWHKQQSLLTGTALGAGIGFSAGGPVGAAVGAAIGGGAGALLRARFTPGGRFAWLNPILENTRRGLLDNYGLDPDYVKRGREAKLEERARLQQIPEMLAIFKDRGIGAQEAKVLQAVLTGETVAPAEWADLAEPIREAIDMMGQEAVELGQISAESYERNRATYLHRSYLKHEDAGTLTGMIAGMKRSYRKKIIGNQLKGRGLWMTAKLAKMFPDVEDAVRPPVGAKFRVLDRLSEDDGTLGSADAKVLERRYLPDTDTVPDDMADWKDRGVFEVRGWERGRVVLWRDWTKAERMQMGEIMDARYNIAKTWMGMAHDLSVGKFYRDISKNADWATEDLPDGANWKDGGDYGVFAGRAWDDVTIEWVKVPDTVVAKSRAKRYGALAGMYVRSEIWRDIHEMELMNKASLWKTILSGWKVSKTALSPVVHMNNVMSNVMFMDLADVRTRDLVRGIRSISTKDAAYKEALENGAFGADLISNEIRQNVLKPILAEIEREFGSGNAVGTPGNVRLLGRVGELTYRFGKKWAIDKPIALYQLEDQWFRMALYLRRRQQGMAPAAAADEAREQFIDYDIKAPWVNMARRSVLPFISYTYRAIPNVAQALATRPWKIAKYFLLANAANMLSYAVFPGDEDKERRATPEELEGFTWIGAPRMLRLPFGDSYGNPMFLDIRRWIPAGDVFDLSQGHSALPLLAWLQPGGPIAIAAELFLNRQAFTGDEIVNELTDDWWDRTSKLADFAWKSAIPSAAWVPGSWYWQKIGRALTGARESGLTGGEPYSIGQAALQSVGIKVKALDVQAEFAIKAFRFNQVEQELRYQMRDLGRQRSRGLISKSAYSAGRQRIIDKVEDLNRNRRETFHGKK